MTDKLSAEIYTDGSCRPNPGRGGWGFHYTDSTGKKISACGFVGEMVTNNASELMAADKAVQYALENNVVDLKILTDSKYVINGTGLLPKWSASSFNKYDGDPIANQDFWKNYHQTLTAWNDKNPPITFEWVRGHSGIEGNEIADRFANRALVQHGKGVTEDYYEEVLDKAVSKPEAINNLLSGSKWYFKSNTPGTLPSGESVYVTLNYENAKAEEETSKKKKKKSRNKNIGKPAADSHVSVVLLKEPIVALDELRTMFDKRMGTEVAPVVADIDYLRRPATWQDLHTNGHRFTEIKGLNAVLPCSHPVAEVVRPPRLIFKLEDTLTTAMQILSQYQDGSKNITVVDLTDQFIEMDKKGKQSLSKNFAQTEKSFTIPNVEVGKHKNNIILSVGIDMPIRNRFSGLLKADAKTPVSFKLLLWDFNDGLAYRVGTVIEQGENVGFYMSPASNLRLQVKAKK